MILNNLEKTGDKNSQLHTMRYRIYLALMTDVDILNFPQAIRGAILSNVLKPGAFFKFLDAKAQSIKPNAEPGESPFNGKIVLNPIIEGISEETLQWIYDNVGLDFLVVWERCSDGQRFIAGDPCSGGLKLSYTSIGELEGGLAGIATALTGGECPNPFWFYKGPLPLEPPTYVPADATTFTLTEKSQYQLTDNTAAKVLTDISGVSDSDVGRVIEILGAGSTNATKISPSAKFILQKGIDFVATSSNRISFYISKIGSSGYAFYEVHRA
ncbi:hypothetical protein HMPREF9455_01399 [Dysgonomonas gadei ATCC BAA-286]|uniref:Uncharacterized protein n=2 Tax=Dysgonomonas gadei TaxID=156974 RepID=F5IWD2_9BACT|nr:hypothetical protein HMPREF9455_01399 [Dysgonomonas gadei ATCC BAA-286]